MKNSCYKEYRHEYDTREEGDITINILDDDMVDACPSKCVSVALERLMANENNKIMNSTPSYVRKLQKSIRLSKVIVMASWLQLQGDGWSRSSSWRESYIIGQVAIARNTLLILLTDSDGFKRENRGPSYTLLPGLIDALHNHATYAMSGLEEALYRIDMSYIMGGPTEVLEKYADVLDELWKLQVKLASEVDGCTGIPNKKHRPDSVQRLLYGYNNVTQALPDRVDGYKRPCPEAEPNLSVAEFRKYYFDCDEPCVFRAYAKEWCNKWNDLASLQQRYGHRYVPLEVGKHNDRDWHERVMKFGTFIEEYLVPSLETDNSNRPEKSECRVAYLAQHPLLEQYHDLKNDYSVPHFIREGELTRINAW